GNEGAVSLAMAAVLAGAMFLAWIVPVSAPLRFDVAEVQYLFPAPFLRRELLGYKIGRLLLAAIAMPVFVTLVIGPVHVVAAAVFYLKFAAIGGFVALHEAGVSLYRVNAKDRGGLRGARRWFVVGAGA